MAEAKKKRKKAARQSWKPHWTISILQKLWMILFGVFKIALGAAATVVIICGICILVFVGTLGDYLQEDIAPFAGLDIGDYGVELNSYVYYLDGNGEIQKLQNLYAENDLEWVDFEDIPQNLINATVAIEDKRFFEHQGVDWVTTVKACFFMFFGNGDRGGSTITQQLVKNLTKEDSYTVQRKVLEIFRAVELEKHYDKEVILEQYLNRIYMGNGCNGVKIAAATYFGKELEMLTIAECASLISITNNPSLYNPYRENLDAGGLTGQERNRKRQMDTLDQMIEQELITQEQYDEAVAQEMVFKRGIALEDSMAKCVAEGCGYRGIVSTLTHEEDGNGYYCPSCGAEVPVGKDASLEVYSYFVDTVLEDVARDLAARDGMEWNEETEGYYKKRISSGGYHIYTTLDMDVQNAVDAIYGDLNQIPKTRSGQQLQSAIVIIDNATGDIVAMRGGVGEKDTHDGQNRATDSKLQTGSSMKPISVYAPAFEAGFSPATVVTDLPYNYDTGSGWPKNDNRQYHYRRTIYTAIRRSVNAIAVNTLDQIGTGYAYNFAKDQFGVSDLLERFVAASGEVKSDIGLAPLALGALTKGVTVRDMASAYATFANNGVYREGRTYTKVYDSNGNLVLDNTQESREILSSKTINYMNYCLLAAVNNGTGGSARISGQNVYGKTGSTSSNKDRWFCGFTGYYTAAVWCGYDQPEVINLVGDQSNPATVLFRKVLTPVHSGLSKVSLLDTSQMRTTTVCLDSGLLATAACKKDVRTVTDDISRVDSALVYREDAPTKSCDKHVVVTYCKDGCGVANEYCEMFAEVEETELEEVALLKLTEKEVEELYKAKKYGLQSEYLQDEYIYLITESGKDANWKGFNGDKNKKVDEPYIVCTLHTKEAWEEYEKSQEPEEPTEPTEPTEPGDPSDTETTPDVPDASPEQ